MAARGRGGRGRIGGEMREGGKKNKCPVMR